MRIVFGVCTAMMLLSGCGGSEPRVDDSVGGSQNGGASTGGSSATGKGGSAGSATTGGLAIAQGGALTGAGGAGIGTANGGSQMLGGNSALGGATAATGGHNTGGIATSAGGKATGGAVSTGGAQNTGGSPSGGKAATGGAAPTSGGSPAGGAVATGGNVATGGAVSAGGSTGVGGSQSRGGTQAAGGTTAGGAAAYSPCPTNGDACKILPLGDSITWGYGYEGAYRVELFAKAVAAQQKITFTGSLSNGPNSANFPKRNEGHSGWKIAQDSGLIPSPALDANSGGIPHIVLVHIGTNDVWDTAATAMRDQLATLVDKVIAAAPNALVVVAKITPLSAAGGNNTVNSYNGLIPALVQDRASKGKHIILADMNTGFTASMLQTDGIHPTQAGYNFMGDRWYSVISGVLPQ